MKNKMTKTVENLEVGETLLVGIRKNQGGKYGVDLAEVIKSPFTDEHNDLIRLFNKSDSRFNVSSSGARRLIFSAEANEIKEYFGVDVDKLDFKKVQKKSGNGEMMYAEVNLLNPEIGGKRIRLVVVESTTPFNDYQMKNREETCKKTPRGEMLLIDGQQIFSVVKMTLGEPKHTFVQHDQIVSVVTPITSNEKEGQLV